jgi:hypothetical protein
MTTYAFYAARADEARSAAGVSTLANVRDRCLRAAAAWEVMASRAERLNRHRAEEEVRRALRQSDAEQLSAPAAPQTACH